jgi:hypothetical protein
VAARRFDGFRVRKPRRRSFPRENRGPEQALAAARETELAHLELLYGIHQHITESVGLIDAGKGTAARKALDVAVVALDKVDFSLLEAKGLVHARRTERSSLELTKAESDGIADFMISHSGTIAAAKEILLRSARDTFTSPSRRAFRALFFPILLSSPHDQHL